MRLTRSALREAAQRVERKRDNAEFRAKVLEVGKWHCRTNNVSFHPDKNLLYDVRFFEEGDHWAHVDSHIWLNQSFDFSESLLFWTLLHEVLHGALTCRGAELSEWREHEIMQLIDNRLIE